MTLVSLLSVVSHHRGSICAICYSTTILIRVVVVILLSSHS